MFRFVSLGSGSSGNCYYISNDQGGIFIDIGVGVKRLRKSSKEYGIDLSGAKYILVTHDHADHVKAVGSVSRACQLPVYATEKVHQHIDKNYVVRSKVDSSLRRYITVGEPFELLGMTISTIPVPHDSSENVGYKIEYDGVVFVLLTDVGHVTDEIEEYVSVANYLVVEANHEVEMLRSGNYPKFLKDRILSDVGHLSNRTCGMLLATCASPCLRHAWLCHLSNDNNTPDLARYTVEAVLRQHGIAPGKDFLLDVLRRNTPSEVIEMV